MSSPDGYIEVNASTGFEALASLDLNHDKVFDAQDAAFGQVRLWQDLNGDGVSQANELSTLADKGIVSISLVSDGKSQELAGGNSITGEAVVTRSNGTTGEADAVALDGTAANLNLTNNPFYREFTDTIVQTDVAQSLPEMRGSGLLRDLRDAMSLGYKSSERLVQAVQSFATATTREEQMQRLNGVLEAWAQTGPNRNDALKDTITIGSYIQDLPPLFTGTLEDRRAQFDAMFGEALDHSDPGWRGQLANADLILQRTSEEPSASPETWALMQLLQSRGLVQWAAYSPPGNTYHPTYYAFVRPLQVPVDASTNLGKISILESFNGGPSFLRNLVFSFYNGYGPSYSLSQPTEAQMTSFNTAFDALKDSVYGALVMQTRMRPYLDAVQLVVDEQGIRFDSSQLGERFETLKQADPSAAFSDLVDLVRYGESMLIALQFNGMDVLSSWVQGLPADSPLHANLRDLHVFSGADVTSTTQRDIYFGDASANTYNGWDGDDQILGGAGNDTLYGGAGDDLIDGQSGNDYLEGSFGNDTYVFGLGTGQDFVNNLDGGANRQDEIRVDASLASDDVVAFREGDNLVLYSRLSNDKITVDRHFADAARSIDRVSFADGVVWNLATIAAKARHPTAGNDVLVYGGSDDVVYGGDGDDILDGGAGTDSFEGGAGADQYIFSSVTGWEWLSTGESGDVKDSIVFTAAIQPGGLQLRRYGNNLDIRVKDANGSFDSNAIVIRSHFAGQGVKDIQFADGTVWSGVTLLNQIAGTYGSAGSDYLSSYEGAGNRLYGFEGNDSLYGSNSDDKLDGGADSDYLSGNGGNDLLLGGASDDSLSGGDGDDILDGSTGSDNYDGGAGADQYVFSSVDGWEWLSTGDYNDAKDSIVFTDAIRASDIQLRRYQNNLDIRVKDANGSFDSKAIVIRSYFAEQGVKDIRFADGTVWAGPTLLNQIVGTFGGWGNDYLYSYEGASNRLYGFEGYDNLFGSNSDDMLDGGSEGDSLNGNGGNDMLYGATGDDHLSGGDGNDILDGGAGSDNYDGGAGTDQYVFSSVDGWEWLNTGDDGQDSIVFTDAIKAGDVQLRRYGGNLDIRVKDSNGSFDTKAIVVRSQFYGTGIKDVRFADGTVWAGAALLDQISGTFGGGGSDYLYSYTGASNRLYGFEGNDLLFGSEWDDMLDGGSEADSLYGYGGADRLIGGTGGDYLNGGDGDDFLDGGADNDTLEGGQGSDEYAFGHGAGSDVIIETDGTSGSFDVVAFGDGIAAADVSFDRHGNSLVAIILSTSDTLTIQDWYSDHQIEEFRFTDGSVLTNAQAQALVGAMSVAATSGTAAQSAYYGPSSRNEIATSALA